MDFGALNGLRSERTRVSKTVAAAVVGLGLATLLPPDAVALPVVRSVSGLLVGGVGRLGGGGLFAWARRASSDCGCSGDCGC